MGEFNEAIFPPYNAQSVPVSHSPAVFHGSATSADEQVVLTICRATIPKIFSGLNAIDNEVDYVGPDSHSECSIKTRRRQTASVQV